jgi:hypothetical protein
MTFGKQSYFHKDTGCRGEVSGGLCLFSGDDQVIFGGMVYPDAKWVETACVTYRNDKNFDILPFHAYPETWTAKST